MWSKLMDLFHKRYSSSKYICFLASVVFAIIFLFVPVLADDSRQIEGNVFSFFIFFFNMYKYYSSRVLVNTVWYVFLKHSVVWYAIITGVSLYVLCYALCELIGIKESGKNGIAMTLFSVAMVLIIPWEVYSDTGWRASTMTYFTPFAFGFFSMIPIKRVIKDESVSKIEKVLWTIALIYAANEELFMVILLGSYLVAALYLSLCKKMNWYMWVQVVIVLLSAAYTLLCPGNHSRGNGSVWKFFKGYEILNPIDKIDIGYTTSMQWLFFGNQLFIIVGLGVLAMILYKKYECVWVRVIAFIPLLLSGIFGFSGENVQGVFPFFYIIKRGIPKSGLINAENRGGIEQFIKFFCFALIIVCILIEIVLASESLAILLASVVTVGAGFCARVIVGFSPDIYGSKYRTCLGFVFAFIFMICLQYASCVKARVFSEKDVKRIEVGSIIIIVYSLINLAYIMVGTKV